MSSLMKRCLALMSAITICAVMAHGAVLMEADFEGAGTNLPGGWTQSPISGSPAVWKIQSGGGASGGSQPGSAHGGTYNATLYYQNTADHKTWLISPVFWTEVYTNLSLTFWHTQTFWNPDQDELKVLYSADGGTNWTELAYYNANVSSWTQRTLSLPTASANSRIAFEGNAKYGYGVCLDDIQVTGDAAVPLPLISVSATDAAASETGPDAGTWTITRSVDTATAVSIPFSLSGTAVETNDYTIDVPSPVSFAAGVTSVVVTLTPVDDAEFGEDGEAATLTLEVGVGYELGATADTIAIDDNDVADLNVLIIGSTADGGDRFGGGSDPFVPTAIAAELESILSGAGLGSAYVEVEERYTTGSDSFGSSYSYNLASWYHWPYPANVETTTRWPNLRGEATPWDYVVLIGDPYTMENLPGHYAHGVEMIAQEVAKGTAETILLMPWQASGSSSSVAHYKEVVYRAGRTGGYKVAPAALAWQADGSDRTGGTHPSARGAYICAASIYSRIWGQSATNSTHDYDAALADLVHTTVTNNVGVPQYSGNKFNFQNPWLMLGDTRRDVHFGEKGSSTEQYYKNGAGRAMDRARVSYSHSPYCDNYTTSDPVAEGGAWTGYSLPIAWNHGRTGTGAKSYVVNPAVWQLAYTFSFQLNSQPYADDEANDFCISRIYSSEVSLANTLKNGDSSQRNLPMRLLWAQFHKKYPLQEPVRDTAWHVNVNTEDAVGAFMYTMYSGRCPLTPGEETTERGYARQLGYETAWRLGTCSARAPGFKVMPSAKTAVTVTPSTTETMTVQFLFAPRSDVTVLISSSDTSAGIVGAQELVFTPANYNVAQSITVAGVPGSPASAAFNVVFSTISDDPVYDGLSDSWAYSCVRSDTTVSSTDHGTVQYSTPKNFPVTINLNASGADAGNTVFAGPNHGALSWNGPDVVYTPDTDYIGPDGFAYYALVGSTLTVGYIDIDVLDSYPAGSVRAEATDSTATEEGPATGTLTIIREGDTSSPLAVNFSLSGTATSGDDYTLSASSPVTIPAGSNTIDIILTPVDDAVSGEHTETASLTVIAGAGYVEISNPATVSITDNDNTPPVVDAGTNQTVQLSASTPWTPNSTTATRAWYDATDGTTITASGSAVTLWSDKSGNDYHLSGAAGREPITGTRTFNGLNAIDFQAADVLTIGDRLGFGANPDLMALLVMQVDSTASDRGAIFVFGNSASHQLRTGTFSGNVGWFYSGGNEKYGAVTAGSPFIGCWQRPSGGDYVSASFYEDGTERSATASSSGTLSPVDNTSSFAVGGDPDDSSFLDAGIGEIVLIESNDTNLRQNAEGYLAHKWGLAANLPADHPYKAGAPGAPGVTVNLNGTTNDVDGDTLTTTWTLVSGPSSLTIDDASAVDTTVTFWEEGTYVLRLTADDGYGPVLDEMTIVVDPPLQVSVTATDAAASETGPDAGSWTISRVGDTTDPVEVSFSLSGTATENVDYTKDVTSPVTILAGQTPVVVTLTPVDDTVFGEGDEAATLTITGTDNPAYTIGTASNDVIIADNDNNAPVVNAGPDQSVAMEGAAGPTELIIAPTDAIQGFQSTSIGGNSTDGSNWPAGENPQDVIDGNTGSKYLNFGKVGSGFYITPGAGLTTLTGVKIYTANDVPGRDPLTVSIEGANGGDLSQGSSWTLIASNVNLGIDSDPGRQTAGPLVDVVGAGTFTSYRVIVQAMRNAGDNSTQYSEFELHGYTGTPTAVTLDGTVTDADGQTPTTTWTLVSSDPGGLTATFADASAVDTTVTFTEAGVYTLRLTADDSTDVVVDECIISVGPVTTNHSVPHSWLEAQDPTWATNYESWALADPDGDGRSTWEEYWSGTDPTNSESVLRIDQVLATETNVQLIWAHARVDGAIPPVSIQRRVSLVTGEWMHVGEKIPVDGTVSWDSLTPLDGFFRLCVTNAP